MDITTAPAIDGGTTTRGTYDHDRCMIFWGIDELMNYYESKSKK